MFWGVRVRSPDFHLHLKVALYLGSIILPSPKCLCRGILPCSTPHPPRIYGKELLVIRAGLRYWDQLLVSGTTAIALNP